jgi:hypothetical protein
MKRNETKLKKKNNIKQIKTKPKKTHDHTEILWRENNKTKRTKKEEKKRNDIGRHEDTHEVKQSKPNRRKVNEQ